MIIESYFLGSKYDLEKTWLLREATAFVQPSTLEGLSDCLALKLSRWIRRP